MISFRSLIRSMVDPVPRAPSKYLRWLVWISPLCVPLVAVFAVDYVPRAWQPPFVVAWGVVALVILAWAMFRDYRVHETRRLQDMGLCPRCGYDLRASPGPKCPECGEYYRAMPGDESKFGYQPEERPPKAE